MSNEHRMIAFDKMQSLGNDFVIIENLSLSISLSKEDITILADRHRGIGFDQLLLLEESETDKALYSVRIFNADGHEVEQCGNGLRSIAAYCLRHGLTETKNFKLSINSRIVTLELFDNDIVSVDMGQPIFEPTAIPFLAEQQLKTYSLFIHGDSFETNVISMGNPHAVLFCSDVAEAPVEKFGKAMINYERFPEGTNFEFAQVVDRGIIKLRIYERGVGETMACGSGACAAVVAGIQNDYLENDVKVIMPGGELQVRWLDQKAGVSLIGPVHHVFEGQFLYPLKGKD